MFGCSSWLVTCASKVNASRQLSSPAAVGRKNFTAIDRPVARSFAT